MESWYLVDCRNCINCFGCVGLVNKKYYIFNQPYSKEDYEKFIKEIDNNTFLDKKIDGTPTNNDDMEKTIALEEKIKKLSELL